MRTVSPSYPRRSVSGTPSIISIVGAQAEAAGSRISGSRRTRGRIILIIASLLVITVLSYSSGGPRYLDQQHREQLLQELGQLQDKAFQIPDHLKARFGASQVAFCGNQVPSPPTENIEDDLPPVEGWAPPIPVPELLPQVEDFGPSIIPGYGALSDPKNPSRDKFLVPIFACDEQETGAQMHIRQALHLGKAMGRTTILPNFGGKGIPTLSNCQSFAFDDIYEIESASSAGLWTAAYPTWKRFIAQMTNGKEKTLSAQLAVVFSRYAFDQITHLPISDADLLSQACVDTYPFSVKGPRLYVSTENQEPIQRVVDSLRGAEDKDVIFVYFNHKSVFVSPEIEDNLPQARPQWGLWVRNPFPYWNYSTTIDAVFEDGRSRLPEKFIAMQWRMERVPPETLEHCVDMFLDSIGSTIQQHGTDTLYVASDAPLRPDQPFKSASWDLVYSQGVRNSIAKLMGGLEQANIKVVTWDDIKPTELPLSFIADDAPGIFDRLIVGKAADWVYAPNINCGMKSAYLGSIQTARQDRIGDAAETDWDKLGMTWIGEPLAGDFWWTIIPPWENWDKTKAQ